MDNSLTTFYIVRHGETEWNLGKRLQGQTDIPLNETGENQAKELGEQLKNIKFDIAFSSDLMRAKRTAEIIALEHKLEVEVTELLRERKYGQFEGKTHEAIKDYDELRERMSHEERFSHKFDGDVESDEEISSRLITFLRETAITHPGKTVLVGTHSGIMRALLIKLGAVSYADFHHGSIKNGAYVVLESDGVEFIIKETVGIHRKESN